ncbi:MAG: AAA family ATPase [Clostridia bacterium]
MRKIVPESLHESMIISGQLTEGLLSSIKNLFKKIGNYFVGLLNGETIPAMLPVNIAILYANRKLPKCVTVIPSKSDIELEPSLAAFKTNKYVLAKRGGVNEGALNEMVVKLEHPDPNIPNIKAPELMRRLRMVIRNRQAKPLLIWGAPGIAKTAIVKEVLQIMGDGNGQVIDLQLSTMMRDDWFLPGFVEDEMGFKRSADIPKTWLPVYKKTANAEMNAKGNDLANQGGGGIIFLDELSRADKGVQATLLKFVDERHVGEWYLGDKWTIVSASNRQDDDPTATYNMSTALASRFSQVNFIADFKAWRQWATGSKPEAKESLLRVGEWKKMIAKTKIDSRILDFIEFSPDFFYTLENESTIFASPRTWEAATKNIVDAIDDETETNDRLSYDELKNIIAGDVGMNVATEFMTFMRLLQTFTQEDIKQVLNDPMKAKLPAKVGKSKDAKGYDQAESNALISIVCSYTKDKPITPKEWENYNTYLVRLDNGSLAAKGHKLMIQCNDFINAELGEADDPTIGKKKDKYLKGYNIFVEKYGDLFK